MMPRKDSKLDSDWISFTNESSVMAHQMSDFDQSESLNSESVLREHFISNYIMGRQLALSNIDVSSIDMLFFPDQETFNFTTVRFK